MLPMKFARRIITWTNLIRQRRALYESIPTVMVMQENGQNRVQTHVLIRGQYDHPGDAVQPGVPRALPPLHRT